LVGCCCICQVVERHADVDCCVGSMEVWLGHIYFLLFL
jgi:hypothetical protein